MPEGVGSRMPLASNMPRESSVPLLPSTGRIRRELAACVALSWPLMLTNTIEMAMNMTNLAMIGRISPAALAASTLGQALSNVFLIFGVGVTASVAALISRAIGTGPEGHALVRRIVQQGLWGALIIAVPAWLIMWNADAVFTLLGQDPQLSQAATSYLHVLQWSILPALIYLVLRSLFAALERPRWAVGTGTVAVALNAVLNWALIGGHAGLPALGLIGSGIATLLANTFMAASLICVAAWDPRLRRLRIFAGVLRPSWHGFAAFWRLGLPIGISLLLEVGMFAGATLLVGHVDAPSLAAHAIALQVASLTFMVPLGIGQAATIRIGRASGAGERARVVLAGWTALALGVAAMTASAVILISLPGPITDLFLRDGEPGARTVQATAVLLLGLAGLFQIADGSQVVLAGMLRGLHDTRVPMLISAVGYWGVGLPVAAVLAFVWDLRAPGVWLGMTAGLFTVATLLLARWRLHLR